MLCLKKEKKILSAFQGSLKTLGHSQVQMLCDMSALKVGMVAFGSSTRIQNTGLKEQTVNEWVMIF